MAKARKRTGRKSPHKKSLFASHFQRAEKNKQRRILKDKVEKEKKVNSKGHRHIWKLEGYSNSEKRQKCPLCETKRTKKYNVNIKNLQSYWSVNPSSISKREVTNTRVQR